MSEKTKSWKENKKLIFDPKYVKHTVGKNEFRFHPISVNMIGKCRVFANQFADAFSTLIDRFLSQDQGNSRQDTKDGKTGNFTSSTVIDPPSPEIAIFRGKQLQLSLSTIFNMLTEPENATIVGMLIIDSIREEFELNREAEIDKKMAEEFMASLDLISLKGFLHGFAKANAQVFGPLQSQVVQTGRMVMDGLERKLSPDGSQEKEVPSG